MAPSLSDLIATSVEQSGVPPGEMEELVLDGNKGWTMDPAGLKKLGELTAITMISMNDCDLKKLETFPEALTELEVQTNFFHRDIRTPSPERGRNLAPRLSLGYPNFGRIVLGYIEADFCKQRLIF